MTAPLLRAPLHDSPGKIFCLGYRFLAWFGLGASIWQHADHNPDSRHEAERWIWSKRGQERKSPLGRQALERFDQVSPVGTIAAVSTIKITLLSGARVQCNTPFGTVKP